MDRYTGIIIFALLFLYYWFGPGKVNYFARLLSKRNFESFFQKIDIELKRKISLANRQELKILKGTANFYLGHFSNCIEIFNELDIHKLDHNVYKKMMFFRFLALFFSNRWLEFMNEFNKNKDILFNERGRKKINQQLMVISAIQLFIDEEFPACRSLLHTICQKKAPYGGYNNISHFVLGLLEQKCDNPMEAIYQFQYVLKYSTEQSFLRVLAEQKLNELE